MPSAQQKEIEEPVVTANEPRSDLLALLHAIRAANIANLNSVRSHGSVLFSEGEAAVGVYILRTGRATVSISSSEGRVVLLHTAHAGEVLGLNSVLQGGFYETTVKTLGPCQIEFISRAELLEVMQRSHAAIQVILTMLSRELAELTDRAKLLLLSQTVRGRLARLLLDWSKKAPSDTSRRVRLERVFTHEEIAQMICSSRETVTRVLASLGQQQIIRVTSDSILICDRAALEKLALS